MKIILLCITLWFTAATVRLSADEPAVKQYVYKTSGGKEQTLEIHFPPGHAPSGTKAPGLILFHGGGWIGGNPDQFGKICAYFSKRGMVAATASYQMVTREEITRGKTEHKRPCVTDAASAIRWFKQHASDLGVDPARIVTGGGSAGGHICVLATLNRALDNPADPKDQDTSVLGYLLFNPAFTLPGAERDKEVSAFAHLKPGIAPSLFLFGSKDGWKPASDALLPELRKTGAKVNFLVASDEGHSFWRKPEWQELCLIECDRFLVSLGVLTGPPGIQPPKGAKFAFRDEDLPAPQKP